jgi:hypothetical protein
MFARVDVLDAVAMKRFARDRPLSMRETDEGWDESSLERKKSGQDEVILFAGGRGEGEVESVESVAGAT